MIDRLGRRHADTVTIRFCAEPKKTLTAEAVNPDGSTAIAGSLFAVAAWLEHYGYRYVLGANGVWVRQLQTARPAPFYGVSL